MGKPRYHPPIDHPDPRLLAQRQNVLEQVHTRPVQVLRAHHRSTKPLRPRDRLAEIGGQPVVMEGDDVRVVGLDHLHRRFAGVGAPVSVPQGAG